jgi:GH24 family phage-related lysozyme (muramidase)
VEINEAGLKLIKSFEGCRLQAYKPVPTEKEFTIGWGHYGVPAGTVWTQQQADDMLKQDLTKYERYVSNLHRDFNVNQFSALVSFCFNLGSGNLKTLCNNRTNAQIADALLLYNKGGGKVLDGLKRRRKAERELFLTPVNSETTSSIEPLPYKVRTKCDLCIRTGPGVNFSRIRTAKKGSVLTVWAIETNGDTKWGKNGNEYFSLAYCENL